MNLAILPNSNDTWATEGLLSQDLFWFLLLLSVVARFIVTTANQVLWFQEQRKKLIETKTIEFSEGSLPRTHQINVNNEQ